VLDRREFLSAAAVAALAACPIARAAAPKRSYTEQAYTKAIVIDALGGPGGYDPDAPGDQLTAGMLADVKTDASYAMARSYGDYTTNLPLKDLTNGQALIAFRFDDKDLAPEHGGPARLLVPHLYLWKSAKWVRGITLMSHDKPGFWESLGYHIYGDPWREQRYSGDE